MSAKKPITYTVIILDQSGSMDSIRSEAVMAYNEQVQQAKINARDQEIYCSLLTFNGDVYEHLWNIAAADLKESTDQDYICDGGTALNDAIGYAIDKLLKTTNHEDENVSYLVQVVTDGQENQSRHFAPTTEYKGNENGMMLPVQVNRLRDLIAKVQATGRWTFSFMGCSKDYLQALAEQTSVPISNMAAWAPNNLQAAALTAGSATNAFYRSRSAGATASANYLSATTDTCADLNDVSLAAAMALNQEEKTAGGIVLPEEQKVSCFANHEAVKW